MRHKEKLLKFVWIVASIAITVALLEFGGMLIWRNLPERFENGKHLVEIFAMMENSKPDEIEPHPYLLYQPTKNYSEKGFLQHNSLRYRNPEFSPSKKKDTTRILALGGSTTYGYHIPNPKETWVALLEKKLNGNFSSEFQVVNAGLNYGTSAELLASYAFRHQFLDPDLVIIHTGGNDVAPLMFPGYDPEYTHFRAHGSGRIPRKFERGLLNMSYFAKASYALWLNRQGSVYQAQPSFFELLDHKKVLQRIEDSNSTGFERNLNTLIGIAKSNGTQVVLFGFLQAKEENLTRKRHDLKGHERAFVIGLEKHYEIMRKLAAKHEIEFIEPDPSLFEEEWFVDNCHLTVEGQQKKAEILHQYFMREKMGSGVPQKDSEKNALEPSER